jgi:hypothetical protein
MIGVLLAMMRLLAAIPHPPRNAHERSEFGLGSLLEEWLEQRGRLRRSRCVSASCLTTRARSPQRAVAPREQLGNRLVWVIRYALHVHRRERMIR